MSQGHLWARAVLSLSSATIGICAIAEFTHNEFAAHFHGMSAAVSRICDCELIYGDAGAVHSVNNTIDHNLRPCQHACRPLQPAYWTQHIAAALVTPFSCQLIRAALPWFWLIGSIEWVHGLVWQGSPCRNGSTTRRKYRLRYVLSLIDANYIWK